MSASRHARLRLPVRPSAEHLKKQAKRRAKAQGLTLADAQHALAKDYGCRDWAQLMHMVETMLRGADKLANVRYDFEVLPKAANANDLDAVRRILAEGSFTQHDLDLALARSVLRFDERGSIARLLLEHGADPDGQYGSGYGPIIFGTGECLDVEGLRFLIEAGADVTFEPIDTKYGRQCPLGCWLGTYVRGCNEAKHHGIDLLLEHGAVVPAEVTPPIFAIHRGDAAALAALLDADPALVRRTFPDMPYGNVLLKGATLLHCAIEFGELDCCALLLERGADINQRAEVHDGLGGQTPIYHAISPNQSRPGACADVLPWLIERVGRWIDLSVQARFCTSMALLPHAMTPLQFAQHEAASDWAAQRKAVEQAIELLAPLDRLSALKQAILAEDQAAVERILDEHPALLTPQLWPPAVHQAQSLAMTRLLLGRGLDPDQCGAPRKPLHLAASIGRVDLVALLLEHGANPDVLDGEHITPLELAAGAISGEASENADATIARLRQHGATVSPFAAMLLGEDDAVLEAFDRDPSLLHQTGWQHSPPLIAAARAARPRVVQMLVQRGSEADGALDNGNTPLWFVCQSGKPDADRLAVAKLLIDAGADVNRRCEDGSTPLHFAAWRGPAAMGRLMLDHSARAWLGDDRGRTAADYARESKVNAERDATVRLLEEVDFGDTQLGEAVAMIDAGEVEQLQQLLAEHPHLATARVMGDSAITRGYFTRPTLLHFVANNPNRNTHMPPRTLESTAVILDAGAAVDAKTEHASGGTTLALVASSEPAHADNLVLPLIELLVSRGADPAKALPAAVAHRYLDTARALIRLGAAHTLQSAAALGEIDTLQTLLDSQPCEGERLAAMHVAAVNGQTRCVETLLASGLDINARMPRPFEPTMLHEAASFNHAQLATRLLELGADPTLRDTQFHGTPADWAAHGGHEALAATLRAADNDFHHRPDAST